jgi:ABC-type spermidine/putrescine transport system permease subunit II
MFRSRTVRVLVMVAVMLMQLTSLALANTNQGTEFQNLYDKIVGWVQGLPGIIIGIGLAIGGVIKGATGGGILWVFGGLIAAAVVIMLPGIIAGLGGATI